MVGVKEFLGRILFEFSATERDERGIFDVLNFLLNSFFLGKKPKFMNDEAARRLCFSSKYCGVVIKNLFKKNQGKELQDWDLTAIRNFVKLFFMSSMQELKLKKIVFGRIEILHCLTQYAFFCSQ